MEDMVMDDFDFSVLFRSTIGFDRLARVLKGAPFATVALPHDIYVSVPSGGTRAGHFLPSRIR
jgi:hypothetical protein